MRHGAQDDKTRLNLILSGLSLIRAQPSVEASFLFGIEFREGSIRVLQTIQTGIMQVLFWPGNAAQKQ